MNFGTVGEDWEDICLTQHVGIGATERQVWSWGTNTYGQLGVGNSTGVVSPLPVSVSLPTGTYEFSRNGFDSNYYTAIVRRKSDGTLFSWGMNDYGQLGVGGYQNAYVPTSVSSADSWKAVAGGYYHSLAIRGSDGKLYAWGYNSYGQLGDNTNTHRSVPTSVSSADSWVKIACGQYHSLAIRGSDGKLYAWGYNGNGQLGDNSTTSRSVPTSVFSANSWVAVACGLNYSFAIRGSDGKLYAWGYNLYGQLGDNSRVDKSIPTSVSSADSWVEVKGGGYHSLAIRGSDGKLYAWGYNGYGQLGDNSVTSRSVPTSVSSADSWVAVAGGQYHSLAIRGSDGKIYAWGDNSYGQLGDNTNTHRSVPTSVSSADSWKVIGDGYTYSRAIRGSDGKLYAWGNNNYGQLGDNSTTSRSVPTSVSSADSWVAIACEWWVSSLALRGGDGLAYSWGGNTFGELGIEYLLSASVPCSIATALSTFTTCGYHSLAIRGSDGKLYAWGNNTSGQLGDGSTAVRAFPSSVSSTDSWKAVACGNLVSVAIRGNDGLAYAWGSSSSGSLGFHVQTSIPGPVSSSDSWVAVAGGYYHSLAIRGSDGLLYAWGDNLYGQLGDNSVISRSVPTSVSSADSWVAVAGGSYYSLAIRGSDGLLYAWGDNTYGQLGDNSRTSRSVPTSVSSADSWVAVACGLNYSLAIRGSDGKLYAWGYNLYGQLGDNSVISRSVPTSVSSADSWVAVAGGVDHSVAIRGSDGKVYTWGSNQYSQLGTGDQYYWSPKLITKLPG